MNPAQELVDLLDDSGNRIGTVTRAEMRANRLPHPCTYILVFHPDGRILIHQRTSTKDIFPGYWDLCIGGVNSAGEDFDTAAGRELKEEIGIQSTLEYLFPFQYADDRTIVFGKVYRTTHPGPFQLQPEEVVQTEWVLIENLTSLFEVRPFCPDGIKVWQSYLSSLGTTASLQGRV
jgi:isopentenyldiphosphate isomerase